VTAPKTFAQIDGLGDRMGAGLRLIKTALTQLTLRLSRGGEPPQELRRRVQKLARSNARLRRVVIRLRQEAAQARHFAYHDALTGLPNRALLLDRLRQAMVQAVRLHKQVGVLVLDLDKFKSVNDRLGHAAGDQLLQQVAGRLSQCIRGGDTACRYGGDEFVVMLPEIDGSECADIVAQKIRSQLTAPYELDHGVAEITVSVGIALYRADGQDCSELIKQADLAMYQGKARRRSVAPQATARALSA
jgi:diguanylate cyclase (GGDEF)-like protein